MLGDRLRKERERLGMTQPVFADAAGAKKRTLIDWEKGVSSPTAVQLSALAEIGADVLYIVTGVPVSTHAALANVRAATEVALKSGGSPADQAQLQGAAFAMLQSLGLNETEQELLVAYRAADESGKKLIEGTAVMAAKAHGMAPPAAVNQTNQGDNAIQVAHAAGKVSIKRR